MRLELRKISKSFNDVLVLDKVDLELAGASLVIIGPSGGGKSTMLRVMAGLIAPDSGQLVFDGEVLPTSEAALKVHRRRIGFVFQSKGLFDHLTSVENITLPLVHVHGKTPVEAKEIAHDLLNRFSLGDQADKRPHEMSGGQQQRVAIARAAAIDPDWLMFDEPTSALDPEYTAEVLDLIVDLRDAGMRIVVVTHHMGFARHACEQVAFLDQGKILEIGAASDVLSNPQTPELQNFLGRVLEWDA